MKFRVATAVVLVGIVMAGGYLGRAVLENSTGGGWSHQAGEAWDAERVMVRMFEAGVPNLVLLVDPVAADLDDPAVVAAVAEMSDGLAAHTAITQVESYWSLGSPDTYATEDGSQGLVTARIGGPESGLAGRADILEQTLTYDDTVIEVSVGGSAMVQRDARQESLGAMALVAVAALLSIGLLFLFLRNLAATGLVAVTAAVAVSLTVVGLWVLERLDRLVIVTTPAVMLALAVSWGSATAAGYVFAHRFIAERRAGAGRTAAVVATVGSAGRTVAVACSVAAAVLLSLGVMPTAIARSTAFATALAVLAAGVAGVLVLGLLLSLFGAGLSTGSGLLEPASRPGLADRLTRLVTAHPVAVVTTAGLVLGGLSLLGLVGLNTGETTADSLPASATSRVVASALDDDFSAAEVDAPFAIGPNVEFGDAPAQLAEYTAALSSVDDVARADSEQGSFAGGVPVATPEPLTARLDSDDANLVRAPLGVRADTVEAQEALGEIQGVSAPFRADIGGTTARHVTTATAMDARSPVLVISAVVAILVLTTLLLHGWRMALRLAVAATLSAVGAILVVRLGFVSGLLTSLFGSTPVETLDAYAGPVAWTVGLALVAGWLILGWGAAREAFDHGRGDPGPVIRSLAATRRTHLDAALLLWLPVLALAFTGWRTQQMIATAVVGAGVVAATVGRFVLTPALLAVAPGRLWPRNVDGSVDPVYPETAATAWLIGAVDRVLPSESPATGVPASDDRIGEDDDLAAWLGVDVDDEPLGAPSAAATVDADADPHRPASADETGADLPAAGPEPEIVTAELSVERRRRRSRWRRLRPGAHDEPWDTDAVADDRPVPEPAEVVEDAGPASTAEVAAPVDEPEEVAAIADDGPVPEPAEAVEDAGPPGAAEVAAPVDDLEEVGAIADDGPAAEPAEAVDVVEPAAPAELVEAAEVVEATESDGTADATEPAEPVEVSEAAPVSEADGGEPGEPGPALETPVVIPVAVDRPVAAVDVISLTESVIASLDADTPFTTEVSSGFVANPSNNLSRVMEAILRDASRRGGEEVLVYGHAAAGRYRWMVVDSGPRADHDPERARTLAEAQRFIRRVGGVVECRPEGDFTVFVVEIPMAS